MNNMILTKFFSEFCLLHYIVQYKYLDTIDNLELNNITVFHLFSVKIKTKLDRKTPSLGNLLFFLFLSLLFVFYFIETITKIGFKCIFFYFCH